MREDYFRKLCIAHESQKQDELIKVYDRILSLDDLTRTPEAETDIHKIATLRQGKTLIDDLFGV